jgi:hypothetical protein
MTENKSSEGGLFTTLLLVAFIVLKLCGVINWSWWWVLSPFWIPAGVALLFFIVFLPFKKDKPEPPKATRWQQRVDEMKYRETMEEIRKRTEEMN